MKLERKLGVKERIQHARTTKEAQAIFDAACKTLEGVPEKTVERWKRVLAARPADLPPVKTTRAERRKLKRKA